MLIAARNAYLWGAFLFARTFRSIIRCEILIAVCGVYVYVYGYCLFVYYHLVNIF